MFLFFSEILMHLVDYKLQKKKCWSASFLFVVCSLSARKNALFSHIQVTDRYVGLPIDTSTPKEIPELQKVSWNLTVRWCWSASSPTVVCSELADQHPSFWVWPVFPWFPVFSVVYCVFHCFFTDFLTKKVKRRQEISKNRQKQK